MSETEQTRGGVRNPEDVIMGIVRRPVLLRDIRRGTLGGMTFERMQLGDFALQLLLETSEFLPRAASYRDFPVAAGAMCKGPGNKFGRVLGYNVKIDDTDIVNIHAEDQVTTKTKDAGFDAIPLLAVIGNPQEDHVSGKLMPTLTPCGRCRGRLENSPLIRKDSLFIMARPDFTVIQIGDLAAINGAHNGGHDTGLVTFEFPETPQILRPRIEFNEWEAVPREPISIPEIDSSDYDETIGLYLSQRFAERRATSQ